MPAPAMVAVAGSGGGTAMRQILAGLPADFPAPILYSQNHLNGFGFGVLADALQWHTALSVRWAEQGDRPKAGVVYLCPPGYFLVAPPDGSLALIPAATRQVLLDTANRLFTSMAASYAGRAVAVVLGGGGWDGIEGVRAVRAQRGTVLVQDDGNNFQGRVPPEAAAGSADLVVRLKDIAPVLVSLVRHGHPLGTLGDMAATFAGRRSPPVPPLLQEGLDALLTMALKMNRTDLGNIQLVEPRTGNLVIVAQRGFGLDFLNHFATVSKEDGSACARAMGAQDPVAIPDVTTDPLFVAHRDIAASTGFRAVQSVPLLNPDETLRGVLSTHFRSHLPPRAELRRLERLAATNLLLTEPQSSGDYPAGR